MPKEFKSYRDASRSNWGRYLEDNQSLSQEDVQHGAILRIADSLEKMEKPFADLITNNEWQRKRIKALEARNATLNKRISAYQGIIKRMKKQKA